MNGALLACALMLGGSTGPEASVITPPALEHAGRADRPTTREDQTVEVLLAVDIDATGAVTAVHVVTSGGANFDTAAMAAVRAFTFRPAREGDEPIGVQIQYRYVFDPIDRPEARPEPEPDPEAAIDDVEVVRAPGVYRDAAQVELGQERGERVAGAQGDVVKAAQALGGVARPELGSGELVIWGAAPGQSRRQVDWVPVPRLFHLGGGRSVLPSPWVDEAVLVPGGFGPAYGRALGGLVIARTAGPRPELDPRRVGGYARVDPIDVGAGVDARLGKRAWGAVALRRSILAQTYGQIAPASARAVVPLPEAWDYQAKTSIALPRDTTLQLLGVGVHDQLDRGIPSRTPDAAFTERRESGFHRVGAQLERVRPGGSNVVVAAWAGVDDDSLEQDWQTVNAGASSRSWRGGLRIEERRRVAPFLVLRWGVDAEAGRSALERRGAVTLPPREGDIHVFGQPPGDRVAADTWRATQASVAAYVSLPFTFANDRWTIDPGLRLEPLVAAGDRILPVRPVEPEVGYARVDVAVDPRLRVRWAPVSALSLFAAGGRYHQMPDPADLSPIFGNPMLASAQAYHAVGGVRAAIGAWVDAELTGYWIRALDLAGRAPEPTPTAARLLVAEQAGRNYGGQASVRVRPADNIYTWVAYSLMRSERRDPQAAAWRLSDFDQTHVLQVLGGWQHRTGVELGMRLSLSSGNPRTAVVAATADTRTGGFDPVFGEHNADRLPLFLELSARAAWGRAWRWGELRVWLDLQNATHHPNAHEYFYSADFSARGTVRGLPILPLLGMQVKR